MTDQTNERLKAIKPRPAGTHPASHRTHEVRASDGGTIKLTYGKGQAIKLHCTECMGFETHPRDCTSIHCALYPFRGQTRAARRG